MKGDLRISLKDSILDTRFQMDMLIVISLVHVSRALALSVALGPQTAGTQREVTPLVQCGTNVIKVTNQPLFN